MQPRRVTYAKVAISEAGITGPLYCVNRAMAALALIFSDRLHGDDWRVEWTRSDGAAEVAIFSGPGAYQRAIRYADRQYGKFEEIDPAPSDE